MLGSGLDIKTGDFQLCLAVRSRLEISPVQRTNQSHSYHVGQGRVWASPRGLHPHLLLQGTDGHLCFEMTFSTGNQNTIWRDYRPRRNE